MMTVAELQAFLAREYGQAAGDFTVERADEAGLCLRLKVAERHLRPGGRIVTGFGAGRDYSFDEFFDDVAQAGLTPDLLLSTWDLRPFTRDADFLVAVLSPTRA